MVLRKRVELRLVSHESSATNTKATSNYLFSYWTSPNSTTYESTAAVVAEGVTVERFAPIVGFSADY
jgi:hypothetical protein